MGSPRSDRCVYEMLNPCRLVIIPSESNGFAYVEALRYPNLVSTNVVRGSYGVVDVPWPHFGPGRMYLNGALGMRRFNLNSKSMDVLI